MADKVYESLCVVTQHEELKQLKEFNKCKKKFKEFIENQERMQTAYEAGHTLEGYLAYAQDQRPNIILAIDGISESGMNGETDLLFSGLAEDIAGLWKQATPSLRNYFFEDAQKNRPHANERVFQRFLPYEVAQLLNALDNNKESWCSCDSDEEGY